MKRIMALALAALLALGGQAALAGNGGLGETTLLVKERLGIGDDYSEFYSDSYEDAAGSVYWNLSWSGERGSAYVTCDTQGTIYEYSRYDNDGEIEPWSSDFAPRLTEETEEIYRPAAEEFLDRVVAGDCGWRIEDGYAGTRNFRVSEFVFTGVLTRGGYDTGVRMHVTVRAQDKAVTSFWRGDAYTVYTSFAIPDRLFDEAEARALLEKGLGMELLYVSDEPGKAVLRYMPVRAGGSYVDAATGKLFEPDEDGPVPYAVEAAADAGGKGGETVPRAALTEAELSGIQAAEELLSREELDTLARGNAWFGLDERFVLTRVHTTRDGDQGPVAVLRYQAEVDEEALRGSYGFSEEALADARVRQEVFAITKTVCLDAKTGGLVSLNTYYPFGGGLYTYTERTGEEVRAAADAFLEAYFPERFAAARFREGGFDADRNWYNPQWSLSYERVEDGVPFRDDYFQVGVNVDSGFVDDFHTHWTDAVEFESREGVVSEETARDIWLGQFTTGLGFVDVVDSRTEYDVTYKGVLCYSLRSAGNPAGVNARDGSVFSYDDGERDLAYTDLEGHPSRDAIETLAAHGIGFADDAFRPDEELALRDWLVLLLKAGDYKWVDASEDADLLSMARSVGIPLPGADLSAPVTRAGVARMLVGMSGYGKAAMLREAFVCGFDDDGELSDEDYGYIAIARAMGVARAGEDGAFRPAANATRAEAAEMLLAFLTRSI